MASKGPFFSVPFLWAIKEKGPGVQGRSARDFDVELNSKLKAYAPYFSTIIAPPNPPEAQAVASPSRASGFPFIP